ncbi:hypothetical protein AB8O64_35525 (plasmid) [Streptomyces sp. QH1-20]|uniref:hypothetical protein n=1 Tax=Streptomyces sp. QH1-20 TaxID=3240934 RepID=UPI0035112C33
MAKRTRVVVLSLGTLIVLTAATAVALLLSDKLLDGRHAKADAFPTGKEAKETRHTLPRWLPDDATNVKWNWKTTDDERMLKAVLPSASLPTTCTALKSSATAPVPDVKSDWFPDDAAGKATARCDGGYYAYLDGTTLIAWLNQDDARTAP